MDWSILAEGGHLVLTVGPPVGSMATVGNTAARR